MQRRYGAKVVMGAVDWDSTLQRPPTAAGGVPKRDIAVGPEGTKITLGDTTVRDVYTMHATRRRGVSSPPEDTMRMRLTVLAGMAMAVLTGMSAGAQQPVMPVNATLPEMPKQTTRTGKHVNRVIDMWLKGQPVYYAQISGGGYEKGKEMAGTKADYITYEMEHGPLDFKELREFMRGLVEAGPTRTGHKTPPVIVTLPISGTTDALRANAWMIQQA
ncbi:MAG TPA: hypothetical protein VFB99_24325, partial [Vicinamibacterales bacterium]|nr:hypothetical protein [Vicinamibacterales bacterium]